MNENNDVEVTTRVHHRHYGHDDIENRSHASVEESISVSRVSSNQTVTSASDTFDRLADRYRFWFLLLSVFLAFWPYYAGYHDTSLEQSILRSSLNDGSMFYETAIASLTLLVPLVFDVILEVADKQSERRRAPVGSVQSVLISQTTTSIKGNALLETREKILIYAGFASTPLLIFVHKDYPNFAMLWFCTTRFQLLAVYGSVWVSFCRLDNTIWPSWTVFLGLTFFAAGLHLTMYNTMFSVQGSLLYVAAILKFSAIYGFFTIPALRYLFLGFFKSLTRLTILPLMYTLTTTISFLVAIIVMTAIGSYDNLNNVGLLLYNGAMILLELGFLMFYMRKEKVKSIFDELIAEMQLERETLLQRMDASAHLIIHNEENADDDMCPDDDDHMVLNARGDRKEISTGVHLQGNPIPNQDISNYQHIANKSQKSLQLHPQKTPTGDMAALRHAYRQAKNAANIVDTNAPFHWGRGVSTSPKVSGSPFGALHKFDRNNFECESSLTSRSAGDTAPSVNRLQVMNPFDNGVNNRKQKGPPSHVVVDMAKGNTTTKTTLNTSPFHSSLLPLPIADNTNNSMIYGNYKIDEVNENDDDDSSLPKSLQQSTHITEVFDISSKMNTDSVSSPAAITQTLSYMGSQNLSEHLSLSLSKSTPPDDQVEGEKDKRGFIVNLHDSQLPLQSLPQTQHHCEIIDSQPTNS